MKVYHGMRTEHGCTVVVEEDGDFTGLDHRRDLRNLSSDGLEWGTAGSGPAQLALALAADVLGDDDKAQELYRRLESKLIGDLPHEGWVLTERRLRAALDGIEQRQERTR